MTFSSDLLLSPVSIPTTLLFVSPPPQPPHRGYGVGSAPLKEKQMKELVPPRGKRTVHRQPWQGPSLPGPAELGHGPGTRLRVQCDREWCPPSCFWKLLGPPCLKNSQPNPIPPLDGTQTSAERGRGLAPEVRKLFHWSVWTWRASSGNKAFHTLLTCPTSPLQAPCHTPEDTGNKVTIGLYMPLSKTEKVPLMAGRRRPPPPGYASQPRALVQCTTQAALLNNPTPEKQD